MLLPICLNARAELPAWKPTCPFYMAFWGRAWHNGWATPAWLQPVPPTAVSPRARAKKTPFRSALCQPSPRTHEWHLSPGVRGSEPWTQRGPSHPGAHTSTHMAELDASSMCSPASIQTWMVSWGPPQDAQWASMKAGTLDIGCGAWGDPLPL